MKKRSALLWKRLLPRIIIILLGIAFLFCYFFTTIFSIKTYDLVGVDDIYKENLILTLQELSTRKILFFLPGNSIFTYHRTDIKNLIREVLPNTDTITIYPPTPQTLRITVTPYTPLFRKNDVQAISANGVVYKEIYDISTLPILITSTSTLPSPEVLQALFTLHTKISSALFPITEIYIDERGDAYLRSKQTKSEIRVASSSDASLVWSTIVSAIDTEPLKSKLQKEKLLYLDARFGNKVFYRFTNGTEKAIIGDDTTSYASSTRTNSTSTRSR